MAGVLSADGTRKVVAAASAVVLAARWKDATCLPRLLLGPNGSPESTIHIGAAAAVLFGYERVVGKLLQRFGLTRIPSTLAAMLSLFALLRTTQKLAGRETSDKLASRLTPGTDFLGKWMGLFLAPPLVSLDDRLAALPKYGGDVWAKTAAILGLGWLKTHAIATVVALAMLPRGKLQPQQPQPKQQAAKTVTANAPAPAGPSEAAVQADAVRRAWVFLGACGFLTFSAGPAALAVPAGRLCHLSTTVGSIALAQGLLPDAVKRPLNPLMICAVSSNLASRYTRPAAPYFDGGMAVGDVLFKWLPAAVTGLGVRMYMTTDKWLDKADDFKLVLTTCTTSGAASLLGTALLAVAPQSPLSVPAPLSLPLLNRSVMSALGIDGSKTIGAPCEPQLAVASILITGCIGASFGNAVIDVILGFLGEDARAAYEANGFLVRGVAMGCSAHSIGTAALISYEDPMAAAISGASLCLAGTAHTFFLNLPGVVPAIRSASALPPLA